MSRKDVVDGYAGWARSAFGVDRDPVVPATGTSARRQMGLDGKCSERVRTWRRRVLFRRGAQMHVAMGRDAETHSLAMLDASGIVISWYGRTRWLPSAAEHVLERHVSQFYLPDQAAGQQPSRDLRAASLEGSTTQQGWRRDADGTAFWSTTVIKALVLRDGRLQGFSYLMSASEGPLASVPVASSLELPTHDESADMHGSSRALGFEDTKGRMTRNFGVTHQRSLFSGAVEDAVARMRDRAYARLLFPRRTKYGTASSSVVKPIASLAGALS